MIVHVSEICESKRSYVFDVPDVDFMELFFAFIASWTCVVLW